MISGVLEEVLILASSNVYLSLVNTNVQAASSCGHFRQRSAPGIGHRVIRFDVREIGGRRNKSGSDASADNIDFAVYHASRGMVPRSGHRRALAPGVGLGIVFLHRAEDPLRRVWPYRRIGGSR